jgi:hypothetical protein
MLIRGALNMQEERLGAAQSDDYLNQPRRREGAPKAVYGRLAPAREAQSDDNLNTSPERFAFLANTVI